jgi:cytochrome c6
MRRCLVFAGAIGLSLAQAGLAAEPSEAQIEQGREVYGEFCVTCHGRDMVAPGTVSADLRKFPKEDFERFRNVVMNGKGPAMPPWREKITDEDLTTLWAYVRSGG